LCVIRAQLKNSSIADVVIPVEKSPKKNKKGHPKWYSCFWSRKSTKLDVGWRVWPLFLKQAVKMGDTIFQHLNLFKPQSLWDYTLSYSYM